MMEFTVSGNGVGNKTQHRNFVNNTIKAGKALCRRQIPKELIERHGKNGKLTLKETGGVPVVGNIPNSIVGQGVNPRYIDQTKREWVQNLPDHWVFAMHNTSQHVLQAWAMVNDVEVNGEKVRNIHVLCAAPGKGKPLHDYIKEHARQLGIHHMVLGAANYTLTRHYGRWGYQMDTDQKYVEAHHGEATDKWQLLNEPKAKLLLSDPYQLDPPLFGMHRPVVTPPLQPQPQPHSRSRSPPARRSHSRSVRRSRSRSRGRRSPSPLNLQPPREYVDLSDDDDVQVTFGLGTQEDPYVLDATCRKRTRRRCKPVRRRSTTKKRR